MVYGLITGNFTMTAKVDSVISTKSDGTGSNTMLSSSSTQYRSGIGLCDCLAGSGTSAPVYAQAGFGISSATASGFTDGQYAAIYGGRTAINATSTKGILSGAANVALANSSGNTFSNLYLKLVRTGDNVDSYYSADGVTWGAANTVVITGLSSTLYVGAFFAPGTANANHLTTTLSNVVIKQ